LIVNIAQDSKKIIRNVTIVTVGELSKDFLHPEKICIKNPKAGLAPLDIGAFAYIDREIHLTGLAKTYQSKEHEKIIRVNESSLNINRRKFIIKFIDYIFVSGFTFSTVEGKVNKTRSILNWCDSNNYRDLFDSPEQARQAYIYYISHLNHQISLNTSTKKPRTANGLQNHFKLIFRLYFGTKTLQEIVSEVPIIKFKREEQDVPEETNVKIILHTALHLARGFKDFVIENKPFPYLLKMPNYECNIFPNNGYAYVTPYFKNELAIYNYQEGRVSTASEYQLKRKKAITRSEAERAVGDSQNKLDELNSNSRSYKRLSYASLALQSYTQLFMMITGANASDILNFEYESEFEYERDLFKNNFKNIKLRASGRVVAYSIGGQYGYKIFKEYLELRSWVLNGAECKYLFFIMSKKGDFTQYYNQLSLHDLGRFYIKTKGKFYNENVKNISSSKIRKYKDLVLNELKQSPNDIANSLNHTQSTADSSYSATSPERQKKELSNYWSATRKARELIKIKQPESSDIDKSITVGHCDSVGHPVVSEINTNVPVQVDCKSQYGCLYCEHYSCHADEEDIHKLLSLAYVVEEIRSYGTDIFHVESLFKDLAIRIGYIIGEIQKKSEVHLRLVNTIKKKVFDLGELTVFWEKRLQQYESMGVISV
jgi:hypothetical protein